MVFCGRPSLSVKTCIAGRPRSAMSGASGDAARAMAAQRESTRYKLTTSAGVNRLMATHRKFVLREELQPVHDASPALGGRCMNTWSMEDIVDEGRGAANWPLVLRQMAEVGPRS